MGDLNAIMPHPNGRYNRSGRILERQILKYNLVVLNNSKKPTSFRYLEKKKQHAVLDYFLCSPRIANKFENFRNEMRPWLNGGDAISYYHVPISIEMLMEKSEENGTQRRPSYNFIKANWPLFRAKLDEQLDLINVPDTIEALSKKITEVIKNAALFKIEK